ncbi:COG4705 family protein [Gordonia sp. NPDC003376]
MSPCGDDRTAAVGTPVWTALRANKVPEITIFFWIIKILATTVGETAADYLNMTLGAGLRTTTIVTLVLAVIALIAQFSVRRYIPVVYWWTVLVISVTGTLVTDTLTDSWGVPLITSTTVFAVALILVFAAWYRVERTLSIHSIRTVPREAFYWLAILVTFALGTAAGDLIAERLDLGYRLSAAVFALVIVAIAVAHRSFGLPAVVAFWAAYVVTRPLGASLGDLLTQSRTDGGLGFGTTVTNVVFLAVMVVLVAYLSVTGVDRTGGRTGTEVGVGA